MISGASAARAATMPNSASESPRRSATLSRRDTRSQLVAMETPAPKTKAAIEDPAVIRARRSLTAHLTISGLSLRPCVAREVPDGACRLLGANEHDADQASRLSEYEATPSSAWFD